MDGELPPQSAPPGEERPRPDYDGRTDRAPSAGGSSINIAFYVSRGYHNSPDIFVAPEHVPRSHFGYQFPAHGRNYAGVAHGGGGVRG